MTTKPATTAADYCEATRDANKQRELHPSDMGSIDLDTFRALPQTEQRQIWALASDADKRGLALQCVRRGNHGPDAETIALYLDILESKFGLSAVEAACVGALERLAQQEAASARTARQAGEKDDAAFFQRNANAYAKALSYYLAGVRPTPTPSGWMLPSQRTGEPPHLLTMDGDWTCTCLAGAMMHWAKALVIGIEVGYDSLNDADDEDGTPGPILVTSAPDGLHLTRGDDDIACSEPADVATAIKSFITRLSAARARIAA